MTQLATLSSDPGDRASDRRSSHRWVGPGLFVVGLLMSAAALYMRATGGVPLVTRVPLAIAAPADLRSDAAGRYAEPGGPWQAELAQSLARLRPLHPPMPAPQTGDWLLAHPEPGQRFAAYLAARPNRPTAARHTLYVQPLGPFSADQRRIVRIAADYLSRYFRLPVQVLPDLSTRVIPVSAVRRHPGTHEFQMHTGTLLESVLSPRLPADAAAYIAFTAIDLFPHPRWNFVFGEASLRARVGIWSLARFGDPSRDDAAFRLALLRTIKTATHETGHMFGMAHCTAHVCNMNGANSLEEADRWPVDLCPECLAKTCWLTGARPSDWLREVSAFYREHGLAVEEERAQRSLRALLGDAAPPGAAAQSGVPATGRTY